MCVRHTGFFQWYPRDTVRGTRHKVKHRRFPLSIKKHLFFPVSVTEHWHRLPGEIVDSLSLEIIKYHSTWFLATGSRWLGFNQGVGPEEFWRSLPTSNCSVILWWHHKNLWLNEVVCLIKKSNFWSNAIKQNYDSFAVE